MNVSWATVRTSSMYHNYDYEWGPRLVAAPSVSFFFSFSFFYCANKYLLYLDYVTPPLLPPSAAAEGNRARDALCLEPLA